MELVNGNKGVVVITNSEENNKDNSISVFRRIISCVVESSAIPSDHTSSSLIPHNLQTTSTRTTCVPWMT